jgi:hypothetical protein
MQHSADALLLLSPSDQLVSPLLCSPAGQPVGNQHDREELGGTRNDGRVEEAFVQVKPVNSILSIFKTILEQLYRIIDF